MVYDDQVVLWNGGRMEGGLVVLGPLCGFDSFDEAETVLEKLERKDEG